LRFGTFENRSKAVF